MNNLVYVVPAFTVSLGTLAVFRFRRQWRLKTAGDCPGNVSHQQLARELRPFLGVAKEAKYLDGDELWATLGGFPGLIVIFKAAGVIATLAAERKRVDPEQESLALRILVACSSVDSCPWMHL